MFACKSTDIQFTHMSVLFTYFAAARAQPGLQGPGGDRRRFPSLLIYSPAAGTPFSPSKLDQPDVGPHTSTHGSDLDEIPFL